MQLAHAKQVVSDRQEGKKLWLIQETAIDRTLTNISGKMLISNFTMADHSLVCCRMIKDYGF
jgi:hypothetical protein